MKLKSAFFGVVFFLLVSNSSRAVTCLPPGGQPENVTSFLRSWAGALDALKSGRESVLSSLQNTKATDTEVLLGLMTAEEWYDCSAKHLTPFLNSKNENIALSALEATDGIEGIKSHNKFLYARLKNMMNKVRPTSGAGTEAEKEALEIKGVNTSWRQIANSAVLATHASVVPGEKGKQSILDVTEKEKREIILEIERTFGKPADQGSMHSLELSAKLFLKFLKNKGWKNRTRVEAKKSP